MNSYLHNEYISTWITEGHGEKILFLPGWAESSRVWQESCLENLPDYQKIYMNLGGHFPSSFPKQKDHLTLLEFLECHFEIINKLAGNEKLILIGHSTGAFVLWQYMNKYPEKVEKIILVGTFLEGPLGGIGNLINLVKDWHLSFLIDFAISHSQNSKSIFRNSALSTNPETRSDFLERDDVKILFSNFYSDYKNMKSKSLRMVIEILQNIRISDLHINNSLSLNFIHGDKDPVVPYSQIYKFCQNYENSILYTIAGSGHSPHWENNHKFWEIVKKIILKKHISN